MENTGINIVLFLMFFASPFTGEQSVLVGTNDGGKIRVYSLVVFLTPAGSKYFLTMDFSYLDWSMVMLKSLS